MNPKQQQAHMETMARKSVQVRFAYRYSLITELSKYATKKELDELMKCSTKVLEIALKLAKH